MKNNNAKINEGLNENNEDNDEIINEFGQVMMKNIYLLSIIGEIEGHELLASNVKSTKYEHILPKIAQMEDADNISGILILLQTSGGDCSAGLAIAEMIATTSKPTVSLVIGDCHSIAVPLAAATDYSFIVPTATMIIHPVRMSGTIIGAPQTFEYFKIIQDRIVTFTSMHSHMEKNRIEELMMKKGVITKDLGTILVGKEAVDEGLIDEVGGISNAMKKLYELMK